MGLTTAHMELFSTSSRKNKSEDNKSRSWSVLEVLLESAERGKTMVRLRFCTSSDWLENIVLEDKPITIMMDWEQISSPIYSDQSQQAQIVHKPIKIVKNCARERENTRCKSQFVFLSWVVRRASNSYPIASLLFSLVKFNHSFFSLSTSPDWLKM